MTTPDRPDVTALLEDEEEPPCIGHVPSICCSKLSAAIGAAAVADYRSANVPTPPAEVAGLRAALEFSYRRFRALYSDGPAMHHIAHAMLCGCGNDQHPWRAPEGLFPLHRTALAAQPAAPECVTPCAVCTRTTPHVYHHLAPEAERWVRTHENTEWMSPEQLVEAMAQPAPEAEPERVYGDYDPLMQEAIDLAQPAAPEARMVTDEECIATTTWLNTEPPDPYGFTAREDARDTPEAQK